jgi:hypothetical protein
MEKATWQVGSEVGNEKLRMKSREIRKEIQEIEC